MVTVPFNPTRRVRSRPAQGGFQSSDVPSGAFDLGGAGLVAAGRQIAEGGDLLGQLALQMAEEDNEAAAREADARIANTIRRIRSGGPGPDGQQTIGFDGLQGKAAVDGLGPAEEAIRTAIDTELENASNPTLRSMIEASSQGRLNTALDRMTGHAMNQRLVYLEETSNARKAAALADATTDWNSDEILGRSLGIVQAEVMDAAERNGWSDERIAAQITQEQSVVLKSTFDAALIANDVPRAQSILSRFADRLDAGTLNDMSRSLAADQQTETAQRLASEALADPELRNDPAKMRAWIRDAADGNIESAAISELNARLEEMRGDTRYALAMQRATEEQNTRNRAARVQGILDSIPDNVANDPDPEVTRQWIRDNTEGLDEEAALDLFQRRTERRRGDLRANREDLNEDTTLQAQDAVDQALLDHTDGNGVVDTRAARAQILALEGDLQDEAFRRFEQQIAAERRDSTAERTADDEDRAGRAEILVDQVLGGFDKPIAEMTNAEIRQARAELQRRAQGEDENAAFAMFERRIAAVRGDEAARRAVSAEARAIANHQTTRDAQAERDQLQEAMGDAYNFLYSEGDGNFTVREFRRQNPALYDILARNGRINNLIVAERNIAEGRLFANASDGETLQELLLLPPGERARLEPDVFRQTLTQSEYNRLVASIGAARGRVAADAASAAIYNEGDAALREFAPLGFNPDVSDTARNQMAVATNQLDIWIRERLDQGDRPTTPEIKTEAARLMLQIEADPAGPFNAFEGLAAQRERMTPEQRAVATVPFDAIPPSIFDRIEQAVSQFGVDIDDVDEDVIEEIAGAEAMGDLQRMRKLLEKLSEQP